MSAIGWVSVRVQRGTCISGSRSTSRTSIWSDEPPGPTTRPARTAVTGTPWAPSAFSTSTRLSRWAERPSLSSRETSPPR